MKTIKLCEGHKGGYGFMQTFGMVEKAKIVVVPKSQCEQCKAIKKARKK